MSAPYRMVAVRVFVRDWEGALDFYTRTLEMPLAYRSDGFGWAELETGECHLALERVAENDAEGNALCGRNLCVSLRVEDIHDRYRRLAARGVTFLAPPVQQPWGGWLAHLRDPEGNLITLLGAQS